MCLMNLEFDTQRGQGGRRSGAYRPAMTIDTSLALSILRGAGFDATDAVSQAMVMICSKRCLESLAKNFMTEIFQ